MSSGPENNFIGAVHRVLPAALYRLKNHNVYSSGQADVWYSGKRDLWVEYKFVPMPKRAVTVIDLCSGKNPPLSALQQDWIASRCSEGRDVWVIVGSEAGGVIFREPRQWREPFTAKDFFNMLLPKRDVALEIASFVGVP